MKKLLCVFLFCSVICTFSVGSPAYALEHTPIPASRLAQPPVQYGVEYQFSDGVALFRGCCHYDDNLGYVVWIDVLPPDGVKINAGETDEAYVTINGEVFAFSPKDIIADGETDGVSQRIRFYINASALSSTLPVSITWKDTGTQESFRAEAASDFVLIGKQSPAKIVQTLTDPATGISVTGEFFEGSSLRVYVSDQAEWERTFADPYSGFAWESDDSLKNLLLNIYGNSYWFDIFGPESKLGTQGNAYVTMTIPHKPGASNLKGFYSSVGSLGDHSKRKPISFDFTYDSNTGMITLLLTEDMIRGWPIGFYEAAKEPEPENPTPDHPAANSSSANPDDSGQIQGESSSDHTQQPSASSEAGSDADSETQSQPSSEGRLLMSIDDQSDSSSSDTPSKGTHSTAQLDTGQSASSITKQAGDTADSDAGSGNTAVVVVIVLAVAVLGSAAAVLFLKKRRGKS